jgi:hypothetical protein
MHACKHIAEACKKKHPSFARMLGDAFLLPVVEHAMAVEATLSNLGLDAKAIDWFCHKHSKAVFLRAVQRTTGPSRFRLLRCFTAVIDQFKSFINPATNIFSAPKKIAQNQGHGIEDCTLIR